MYLRNKGCIVLCVTWWCEELAADFWWYRVWIVQGSPWFL